MGDHFITGQLQSAGQPSGEAQRGDCVPPGAGEVFRSRVRASAGPGEQVQLLLPIRSQALRDGTGGGYGPALGQRGEVLRWHQNSGQHFCRGFFRGPPEDRPPTQRTPW